MAVLKLVLLAIALLGIALLGMGIRILFTKNGQFSGGSCQHSPELDKRGITCACGSESACDSETEGLQTISVKEYAG